MSNFIGTGGSDLSMALSKSEANRKAFRITHGKAKMENRRFQQVSPWVKNPLHFHASAAARVKFQRRPAMGKTVEAQNGKTGH